MSSRQATPGPSYSTTVVTSAPPPPPDNLPSAGALRLRGDHSVINGVVRPKSSEGKGKEKEEEGEGEAQENRVTWVEGTVDNEFLGRKSSKICCIFHKSRPFDESSSDESSTDEDEQAAELQRRSRHGTRRKKQHGHDHAEGEECGRGGKKGEPNKLDGGR